jgi:hypothetical protein
MASRQRRRSELAQHLVKLDAFLGPSQASRGGAPTRWSAMGSPSGPEPRPSEPQSDPPVRVVRAAELEARRPVLLHRNHQRSFGSRSRVSACPRWPPTPPDKARLGPSWRQDQLEGTGCEADLGVCSTPTPTTMLFGLRKRTPLVKPGSTAAWFEGAGGLGGRAATLGAAAVGGIR